MTYLIAVRVSGKQSWQLQEVERNFRWNLKVREGLKGIFTVEAPELRGLNRHL
jgi:hypothetical protein